MSPTVFHLIALSPGLAAALLWVVWKLLIEPRHRSLEIRHVIREMLAEQPTVTPAQLLDRMQTRGTRVRMEHSFSELNALYEDGLLDYRCSSVTGASRPGGIREYFFAARPEGSGRPEESY